MTWKRGRSAEDFTICPKCRRRRVLFKFGRNGEDYFICTWHDCDWSCYDQPSSGWDPDKKPRAEWRKVNNLPPEEPL